MQTHLQLSGRMFSPDDILWLTQTISSQKGTCRESLARSFCQYAGWYKPDGGLKDMSCKLALLRLEKMGLLTLPAPRTKNNCSRKPKRTHLADPRPEIRIEASKLDLQFELVTPKTSSFWNELIDRYHYLGYSPLAGGQLRYFVRAGEEILALLGFCAAAWKVRYRYQPLLLETFVEKERFSGTCYKAANWQCVGDTTGRGKWDRLHQNYKPVKSIWLYGLDERFKKRLCE